MLTSVRAVVNSHAQYRLRFTLCAFVKLLLRLYPAR